MKKTLFRIDAKLYVRDEPDFVHDFGHDNCAKTLAHHTFKGRWRRHIAVERVLCFFRHNVLLEWIGDAFPLHELFDALVGMGFGLNCNFPLRHIALYTVWRLRGMKPMRVKRLK